MYYRIMIEKTEIKAGEVITFYANTKRGILVNEEQYENLIHLEAERRIDEEWCTFESWLDENYCASEIYAMPKEEKDNLHSECINCLIDTIREEWEDEEAWAEVKYTVS